MNAEPAISVRNLTKDFRIGLKGLKLRAVDDLSLSIPRGQVFGLLGPNGCGKSTTLKIILGLVTATSGEISILGLPSATPAARARTGFLPEAPYFHKFLSGRELVRYCAHLSGVPQIGWRRRSTKPWRSSRCPKPPSAASGPTPKGCSNASVSPKPSSTTLNWLS